MSRALSVVPPAGGAVEDTPIHVKVTLPKGPTLTLIDLPGITHISEEGSEVRAALLHGRICSASNPVLACCRARASVRAPIAQY